MASTHTSFAPLSAPSFEALIDSIDRPPHLNDDGGSALSYRSSPDGSLNMGTHALSGQVVLIVQNGDNKWEIALPPKVARFAACDVHGSLAAAKQMAEDAFRAYWANR